MLPDHLHTIWTLPAGDADFANRWRLIKTEFSWGIEIGEQRSPSRSAKGERGIWQRRYWERTLRDEMISSAIVITSISIRSSTDTFAP